MLDKYFAPKGEIAKYLGAAYEFRPTQLELATKVGQVLSAKRHFISEAGTGTGKTMAYLIPAIIRAKLAGEVILISTGTKNLQEQIIQKDLPFIRKVLGFPFKAVALKGRSNYACIEKLKTAQNGILLQADEVSQFHKIVEWVSETETGDVNEFAAIEQIPFWRSINANAEKCTGRECPSYENCFLTKAKVAAQNAGVVIVNHHLFFADLSIRQTGETSVLPDYSAVIFDEAHEVEKVAREFLGLRFDEYILEVLLELIEELPINDVQIAKQLVQSAKRAKSNTKALFSFFPEENSEIPLYFFTLRGEKTDAHFRVERIKNELLTITSLIQANDVDANAVIRTAAQAIQTLDVFLEMPKPNEYVYWIERQGSKSAMRQSPIDVAELLRESLFSKVPCVLTSATVATNKRFGFIARRLGVSNPETGLYQTPFDYETQAQLYIPPNAVDGNSPLFDDYALDEIQRLCRLSNGGVFVLCTSNRAMNYYHANSRNLKMKVLKQGTKSKNKLLDEFKMNGNAVLFATSSFWQGVDVQGHALRTVIIDKLPFQMPNEPIIKAICKKIDDNGGSSFLDYSLPQAIITLKQGVGRLIRSKSDTGVVALLDGRLRSKSYGGTFLNSLPPMRMTSSLADLRWATSDAKTGRR